MAHRRKTSKYKVRLGETIPRNCPSLLFKNLEQGCPKTYTSAYINDPLSPKWSALEYTTDKSALSQL